MTKQELLNKIELQGQLPTLPAVVTKVLNLLSNPSVSAHQIGDVISTDLSLSSKTLKIVNSAFYGFPRRISTITQAVVILGFNTIKSAVFGVAVINAFDKYKKSTMLNYNDFWSHSVAVGAASRILAKEVKYENMEEAFIGGIIHDIGKLIFSQFAPKEYQDVMIKVQEKDPNYSMSDIERDILGFNHSDMGGYLIEKWNFPKKLASVVKYHHRPMMRANGGSDETLNCIVSIANVLVNILQIGNSGNYFIEKISQEAWDFLGLSVDNLPDIYDAIKAEYNKSSLFLY